MTMHQAAPHPHSHGHAHEHGHHMMPMHQPERHPHHEPPPAEVVEDGFWRRHTDPGTVLGRHSVRISDDVTVTVAEDEPVKDAVEDELKSIAGHKESRIRKYFDKWRGGIDTSLPFPKLQDVSVTWLGAFIGILVVSLTDHFLWRDHGFHVLVGSFGASAVLLYGVPESKLSQPRNLLGGQILSAVIGVCIRLALHNVQWLANPVGMSLALLVMQLTGTTHPPGGATALIACSMETMAPWHGFQLVLAVALGSIELLFVALIVSNFHKGRAYPTFWW